MALNFPTLKQIIERSRSDLRDILPRLQPSLISSFIRAIVDSNSGRAYDMSILLRQVLDQAFPQTAEGIYLDRWAEYNSLGLTPAQSSRGEIVVTGTALTFVPALTAWTSVAGDQYLTQADVTLSMISQALISASADVALVVTCTTATAHSLATGVAANFTGLTNGANTSGAVITVIDETSFSFVAPGVLVTGDVLGVSPQYTFTGAKVEIESSDPGLNKNLGSGAVMTIVTPIAGVASNSFVDFNEVLGGTDEETADQLRARILDRRANPVANFNEAAIILQAKTIASVSKVFVLPITPYPGAVTIFFFVGDTESGLPTPSQIEDVRNAILEITPVTTDFDDVFVAAPNVVPVTHIIASLSPGTAAMQAAIEANLNAYYEDQVVFGQQITTDAIKLVIQNSQDATGAFPEVFTLTTPAGTVAIASDEIAVFGTVSFT